MSQKQKQQIIVTQVLNILDASAFLFDIIIIKRPSDTSAGLHEKNLLTNFSLL